MGILNTIEKQLEIPFSINIKRDINYLYIHSVGCIGILIDWIKKAIRLGIRTNKKVITKQILESTRLSNIQLEAIYKEAEFFENEHKETGDFNIDLFNKVHSSKRDKSQNKNNHKPGERSPTRDLVCTEDY